MDSQADEDGETLKDFRPFGHLSPVTLGVTPKHLAPGSGRLTPSMDAGDTRASGSEVN